MKQPQPVESIIFNRTVSPPAWASQHPLIWRFAVRPIWRTVEFVIGMSVGMAATIASAAVALAAIAAGIAALLVGLYFLVQFIKWAWMQQ